MSSRVVDGSTTKITSRYPAPTFVAESTGEGNIVKKNNTINMHANAVLKSVIECIHETSEVNLTGYRVS